jgi:hypothetical protein
VGKPGAPLTLVALTALAFVVAGCGGDDDGGSEEVTGASAAADESTTTEEAASGTTAPPTPENFFRGAQSTQPTIPRTGRGILG